MRAALLNARGEGLETPIWSRPQARVFVLAFSIALIARALLVFVVAQVEGCTLSQYASSADGYQFKAVAKGWLGDLDAVRSQEFFKQLVASGGLGSSHLLRFFPASSGPSALCMGVGFPEGPCSTFPAWILSALAAGLAALWARDVRVGLLVTFLPPINLWASTLFGGGWGLACVLAGLLLLRAERVVAAGVVLGLAGWSRPEDLFPALGALAGLAVARRWGAALRVAAGVAIAQIGLVLTVLWRFGDLLDEVSQGAETGAPRGFGFLDLPGRGLWLALGDPSTPAWKPPYVGVHLVLALVALAALAARARRSLRDRDATESWVLLVWLALQLLLALSLRGSQGFDDLPRYLGIAALAVVVGLLPWLPRRWWVVGALCLGSFAVALYPALKNARPECGSGMIASGTETGR